MWMEAALVCDACSEPTDFKPQAAICPSVSDLTDAPQMNSARDDFDEWYCGDIEAEISKLEQQQRSLSDAQLVFDSALLQWRPVPEFAP